jgi:pyridoxamine 5'-phosphate oxidase
MNQKNSLGLDKCFKDLENPIELFKEWFNEAKKTEINDPNVFTLATADSNGIPSARMILLKDYNQNGFIFYTNLNSKKSVDLKENPNASLCFHWKSLLRQIRISGKVSKVSDKESDAYFKTRPYGSKISAWASKQSLVLNNIEELHKLIGDFKKKYPNENDVPRPDYWSGWSLDPNSIEFWLYGENRTHLRLKYIKNDNNNWEKILLNP